MNKPLTAPLDPALADRLLDLLSTDDLFRERFQRDHLAALRTIGYESPTPGQMTACGEASPVAQTESFRDCKVKQLASKDLIREAREEIKAMLLSGLGQTVPQLDVGITASHTLR
ncbi:NHLP-related RiPP peptide [Lysobacter soli]|uniref:NHLP-related RiPP peptide n=1 Tax=Lysobacter soli TaxID=453783 RepID=UPI002410908A|nr:NHLP-related RiPP peptide [Lysobacter soli]MDG2517802.1 NHLP-related RiPP peptide [Lysobacter soli]